MRQWQRAGLRMAANEASGDPATFWEQRYAGTEPIWSGRVNATLAAVAGDLPPGRSLDLGCGEGGDVLWLAQQGWRASGIDISATAVDRARVRAETLGLSAEFVVADLAEWVEVGAGSGRSTGPFDLITASFLQSPVELPRRRIVRAALSRLAPEGRLVLISHAAPPPWASHGHTADANRHRSQGPHFISPTDELAALGELESEFAVLAAELRQREVVDPQGHPAQIDDSVVVVQRVR